MGKFIVQLLKKTKTKKHLVKMLLAYFSIQCQVYILILSVLIITICANADSHKRLLVNLFVNKRTLHKKAIFHYILATTAGKHCMQFGLFMPKVYIYSPPGLLWYMHVAKQ